MKAPIRPGGRIDIARIRREQIVEAAVAVIAGQGIQNLSLSEIESKIGMSRGQLTYYFKTKEDILLAVFDRLVELMCQQRGQANGARVAPSGETWEGLVRYVLGAILQQPPLHPEFGPLQYTFLAQVGHRKDFGQRLARLYAEWRGHLGRLLTGQLPARSRKFSPATLASLIQAVFHGVAIQIAADPEALDREEIVALCLDVLGTYLRKKTAAPRKRKSRVGRLSANGVNHA